MLSNPTGPPGTVNKSPDSKMRSNPPVRLSPTRKNSRGSKRATHHNVLTMTTSRIPSALAGSSKLDSTSQTPGSLQINPEPSRNPFCQVRDLRGLHVEITNQHTRLTPSNCTQFKSSIKQLLSQSQLLCIRIGTLVNLQHHQMHKPTVPKSKPVPYT